jgi:hypothetical protein
VKVDAHRELLEILRVFGQNPMFDDGARKDDTIGLA